jgi:hypothetical protein
VAARVIALLLAKDPGAAASVRDDAPPLLAALNPAYPPLDTSLRNPFQSYLYAMKPGPPHKPARKPIKTLEPPRATVNGILWGDPPVAILAQDGKTELVKAGAEIWDLKVLSIDRHAVEVSKDGRKFRLEY